jgi:hypothetical protein
MFLCCTDFERRHYAAFYRIDCRHTRDDPGAVSLHKSLRSRPASGRRGSPWRRRRCGNWRSCGWRPRCSDRRADWWRRWRPWWSSNNAAATPTAGVLRASAPLVLCASASASTAWLLQLLGVGENADLCTEHRCSRAVQSTHCRVSLQHIGGAALAQRCHEQVPLGETRHGGTRHRKRQLA